MTTLTIEWSDKVAHVQLSRPDSLNALSGEMIEGLVAVGRDLAGRRDCRAVVLSGAGRAFCSGIDLNALRGGGAAAYATAYAGKGGLSSWLPVIAAVHGFALGGGLQLALGADMRIVAPDTRLGFIEVKWGIVPDMGGMALLPGLVRPDIMANLLFTGRIFGGEEAVRIGIATEAADNPFEAAMDLARVIASASPDAVRAAKRLMRVRGDTSSILRAETREGTLLLGGPNQREAMAAGLGKRPGVYAD